MLQEHGCEDVHIETHVDKMKIVEQNILSRQGPSATLHIVGISIFFYPMLIDG